METVGFGAELQDAWVDGDAGARWRSTQGHSGTASASSLLEVPPGCCLPRHVDSAEETVVVVSGSAEVELAGETARLEEGGAALVPRGVPHEVRNAGDRPLRFVAVYAAPEVTTTYESPVLPDGERERQSAGG